LLITEGGFCKPSLCTPLPARKQPTFSTGQRRTVAIVSRDGSEGLYSGLTSTVHMLAPLVMANCM
jgi:hypothetical protein